MCSAARHLPEVLLTIASYQSCQEHSATSADVPTSSAPLIHDRPSLAWCAAHPTARLVAEMHGAEQVVFFDTTARGDRASKDGSALVLASASALPSEARRVVFAKKKDTAPLWRRWLRRLDFAEVNLLGEGEEEAATERVDNGGVGSTSATEGTKDAMQMAAGLTHPCGAARRRGNCGVEMAGLVSVLVSREYLTAGDGGSAKKPAVEQGTGVQPYLSHRVSLPSLRQWLAAHPSPASPGASAGHTHPLVPYLPAAAEAEADFFLFAPATVTQEWLSLPEAAVFARPTRTQEGAPAGTTTEAQRHTAKTAAATYVAARFAATPRNDAYLYRRVFVAESHAVRDLLAEASCWWFQRAIAWHELPQACMPQRKRTHCASTAPREVVPAMHIKLVADLFTAPASERIGAWWLTQMFALHDVLSGKTQTPLPPCRLTERLQRRWGCTASPSLARTVTHRSWWTDARMLAYACGALLYGLLVACTRVVFAAGHSTARLADAPAAQVHGDPLRAAVEATLAKECPDRRRALCQRVGALYASQLESLDVNYTSVTGSDLLAVMSGAAAATCGGDQASAAKLALRALDLSGCRRLHHGSSSPHSASTRPDCVLQRVLEWLPCQSALGRALTLATCAGGLQLLSASGSSLDDAALSELGHACLLLEAAQRASGHAETTVAVRPSVLAMDLSSCAGVSNVSPLGFVGSLLQLLVAFSSVHSAGVACLDGSHYATVLPTLLEPHVDKDPHARAAFELLCGTSASSTTSDVQEVAVSTRAQREARHRLYDTFRSHFYHLDFAYCIPLEDINSLGRQRALQYLNTSHCRLTDSGVRHLSGPPRSDGEVQGPPLRVFIAEFCDLLGTLAGLAWLAQLKKLYVRSSSLTDAGLAALVEHGSPLELFELSYCPKVESLACLSRLPELRTLILDCTEVKRDGVRGLASCPKLETLSLRCCADFAAVGTSKAVFDARVVKIPSLKNYIYEDLIGDEAFREYE